MCAIPCTRRRPSAAQGSVRNCERSLQRTQGGSVRVVDDVGIEEKQAAAGADRDEGVDDRAANRADASQSRSAEDKRRHGLKRAAQRCGVEAQEFVEATAADLGVEALCHLSTAERGRHKGGEESVAAFDVDVAVDGDDCRAVAIDTDADVAVSGDANDDVDITPSVGTELPGQTRRPRSASVALSKRSAPRRCLSRGTHGRAGAT